MKSKVTIYLDDDIEQYLDSIQDQLYETYAMPTTKAKIITSILRRAINEQSDKDNVS